MIYLDTSVALAHLFGEARRPAAELWREEISSSRLLELEVWTRVRARGGPPDEVVQALLDVVAFVEITPETTVLVRQGLASPVRTLDAIHLAAADYLRRAGADVKIASYDARLSEAAARLGFAVA